MVDPTQRVSDDDRERAVQALRTNLVEGRLTLDEFADRAELAFRARTGADLLEVTRDLPAVPARSSTAAHARAATMTLAVFAHVVRSGRIKLRRRSAALSLFGDVDLDLRDAGLRDGRSTLTVFSAFGNVDVYVPAGVDVDVGGLTLLGHRRTWGRSTGPVPAQALYVRCLSVFGTVDVWVVPPETDGDYGAIQRQLSRRRPGLPRGDRG